MTWFRQRAPGSFNPAPRTLTTPSKDPFALATADLDRDGDLDIIVGYQEASTNWLEIFLQDDEDPGTFELWLDMRDNRIRHIAAADVDGDGLTDLVVGPLASPAALVYFQAPGLPLVFEKPPLTLSPPADGDSQWVSVADMDADGSQDIVVLVSKGNDSGLAIFHQTAVREFEQTPQWFTDSRLTGNYAVVADLEGDGDLDVAVAHHTPFGGQGITILLPRGPNRLGTVPTLVEHSDSTMRDVEVADLDADGDLDLITSNDEGLSLFLQASQGQFSTEYFIENPINAGVFKSVAAADLDGDGDVDLASAFAQGFGFGGFLWVYLQSGTVEQGDLFESTGQLLGLAEGPVSIETVDIDGDGDFDLVTANQDTKNLTIFFNLGDGTYNPVPRSLELDAEASIPTAVISADLDCDGDADLICSDTGTHQLWVFLQDDAGQFVRCDPPLSSPGGPRDVIAADLDGDGDLDLVSANAGGKHLALFFQTESCKFEPGPRLDGAGTDLFPVSVSARDVDGDGDVDLVCANAVLHHLAVFLQTSPGRFDPEPILRGGQSTTTQSQAVVLVDMDGDGDMDLLSANPGNASLAIFFGDHGEQ